MKNIFYLVFACAVVLAGCKASKIGGYYNYQTECLGVEGDGSQTVRAWGNGRNRSDAVEQAKKNGVRDVLFKGITYGRTECNQKPLVPEVNAQQKYEDYFNAFFADDGPYKDFVSGKDGSDLHPELFTSRQKAGSQETYRVTIRILRNELKQKLMADGILK